MYERTNTVFDENVIVFFLAKTQRQILMNLISNAINELIKKQLENEKVDVVMVKILSQDNKSQIKDICYVRGVINTWWHNKCQNWEMFKRKCFDVYRIFSS